MIRLRNRWLLIALTLLVGVLLLVSLVIGPADIPPLDGLSALGHGEGVTALVMREIRLPRALLALAIGAALGVSGAALQGYLRNPLADAGVLGVSASAALGAVIALYAGWAALFPLALPLAALVGAVAAVLLILVLAGPRGDAGVLVLAGVAVSGLAGALTSLIINLSGNPFATLDIVFWLLGSLNDRSMLHVQLALPFLVPGVVLLLMLGRSLDALSLGGDTAASLGIRLQRVRLLIVLGTASAVGAATAVAGAIGFVGLVVPHLLRPLTGARPARLLPAAALGGAALLLAADIAARLISPDRDLKLGVVTALIGTPFFLALVLRLRRGMA